MSARRPQNPFRYRFTGTREEPAVKKLYSDAAVPRPYGGGPGLPGGVRVQLAGPPGLRGGPRETPDGRRREGPRRDPRLDEEQLPPHPPRPPRPAERDGPRYLPGPPGAGEGTRRG